MPNLQELLKHAQVEWKTLGEVLKYEQPNNYIVKSTEYNDQFSTPVLTAGQTFILGYTDETQGVFHADKQNPVIIFDDFTASNKWIDFDFKVKSSAMKLLRAKDKSVLLRYCYHYMQTIKFDNTEHRRIWISQYSNIKIPIPSLEVQAEIVRILDTFAELTAELTLRKKQYRYYLEKLLSEEYLRECSEKVGEEVRVVKLKEVCARQKGINITANRMHEIHCPNGEVRIFAGGKTIADVDSSYIDDGDIIHKPSVIVKSRGYIDFEFYDKPFTHKNELWSYSSIDSNVVNIKFIYFYLKNNLKFFLDSAISGKLPQIQTTVTDDYSLPLPPLSVQSHIVGILEKFEHMVQEVSGLLPQEIALRKKQYEYYRDKLLSFNLSWPRMRQ